MKRFIVLLLVLSHTCLFAFAENLTFLKEEYELQYAHKQKKACVNEYVRPTQTLYNWTNIITVHQFLNLSSPQNYINNFLMSVKNSKTHYPICYAPKQNLISFGIIAPQADDKGYIEYNIIRCEGIETGGIKCIQFGHKYKFKDKEDFKNALERSRKYNMKYYNALVSTPIPELETNNYEKKIEKNN